MRFWLAVEIAAILLGGISAPAAVRVEQGLLEGTIEDGLTVYRGIPFAAPPIGDLRWRAPQPAAKWEGVRRADKFAPQCIQGSRDPVPSEQQVSPMSEDCLYLNVWTPAKSASDRIPVLVWIHGGGFIYGATSDPDYGGENLAKKGVVLVSIAYRLGVIGFLAHPSLSAESPKHVSGNYGLLDIIAGLKWIQRNIASFGGDPRKVTIFGESAGGIAASMLCASPLAKGLFQGAISQSGGSFGPPSVLNMPGENMQHIADAERAGKALIKSAGAESIANLRKLPAEKLQAATQELGMAGEDGFTGRIRIAWPIIDGWVIPDDQYKLYEAKRFNDTPILVGYNSDEGASFSPPSSPQDYIEGVRKRYGKFADSLLKAYPVGDTAVSKTARDLMRDTAFGWHTWSWARLHSRLGRSKAYFYYFDQHPDRPADSPWVGYGSLHGMDIAYVFEHLTRRPNWQQNASDYAISEAMATYWTNFAKHGNPNGPGVPDWPSFSENHPVLMHFAQTPHTGAVPSEEGLRTLDAYFAWRRTPEGARAVSGNGSKPEPTNTRGAQ